MSHYCCKRCGQRYEHCKCLPISQLQSSGNSTPETDLTRASKKPSKVDHAYEKNLFFSGCRSVYAEVVPQKSSTGTNEVRLSPPYFYRLVSSNGQTLLVSEAYCGGANKALRALQNLVNALYIHELKVVIKRRNGEDYQRMSANTKPRKLKV